ncbi:MAG: hypothetical protein JWQ87_11 [Candidatus Sulfotelmatobacter sp.]|nr:hypothetical protein [Candidatus Sulfotelmatobacter sp.]
MEQAFHCDDLIRLGSKRRWVPMWLWLHVIFRFGLYEYTPISWFTYKRAKRT